jgi:phage terminase large subunit-like protein
MTTSSISEPSGRQTPHFESAFDGDESDGQRAVKLASRAGVRPMSWQRQALGRILSRREDGSWTHPDVVLISPRQSGKSEILVWRLLFGLFVIGERQVYSARRFVTADSVYRRMKATIESRPSLQRRLLKPPTSSSSRAVIELSNGASVQLGVRSGDLGRGLDAVDLVVFDEAYNLRETEVSALVGAQLSSANNQTIYASTAAVYSQQPNCQVLSDMRKLGLQKQPDLYFAEFCTEDGMPLDDPQTWAYANPSYGLLAKQRDIARLYAKAKIPDALALFKADILGLGDWPPDESEIGAVISADVWQTMANPAPELTGPIAVAVDRSQPQDVEYLRRAAHR